MIASDVPNRILTPPKGCAHCGGPFRAEDNHMVGYKGQDGRVYCSREHAILLCKTQPSEPTSRREISEQIPDSFRTAFSR
jgi:hypothetical protein